MSNNLEILKESDFEAEVSLDLYDFNKLGAVVRMITAVVEDNHMSKVELITLLNKANKYILDVQADLLIEQVYHRLRETKE